MAAVAAISFLVFFCFNSFIFSSVHLSHFCLHFLVSSPASLPHVICCYLLQYPFWLLQHFFHWKHLSNFTASGTDSKCVCPCVFECVCVCQLVYFYPCSRGLARIITRRTYIALDFVVIAYGELVASSSRRQSVLFSSVRLVQLFNKVFIPVLSFSSFFQLFCTSFSVLSQFFCSSFCFVFFRFVSFRFAAAAAATSTPLRFESGHPMLRRIPARVSYCRPGARSLGHGSGIVRQPAIAKIRLQTGAACLPACDARRSLSSSKGNSNDIRHSILICGINA